jgi:hypothetical protein
MIQRSLVITEPLKEVTSCFVQGSVNTDVTYVMSTVGCCNKDGWELGPVAKFYGNDIDTWIQLMTRNFTTTGSYSGRTSLLGVTPI